MLQELIVKRKDYLLRVWQAETLERIKRDEQMELMRVLLNVIDELATVPLNLNGTVVTVAQHFRFDDEVVQLTSSWGVMFEVCGDGKTFRYTDGDERAQFVNPAQAREALLEFIAENLDLSFDVALRVAPAQELA